MFLASDRELNEESILFYESDRQLYEERIVLWKRQPGKECILF